MGRGKGGTFGDISGNLADIGWMTPGLQGTRPLIPSEPGSSTERTARETLEAIRRLERATMWGGAGVGGSSGSASGGGTGSGGGGFSAGRAMGGAGRGAERREKFGHGGVASGKVARGSTPADEKGAQQTGEPEKGAQQTGEPGQYRPVYKLGPADISDAVVNTVAGEARLGDPKSVDAVIDNMLNRVGTKGYGPSGNLKEVAMAPGQYAGHRKPTAAQAAMIRARIEAIASGKVPDITHGANEYRAGYYTGPWAQHHAGAPVIGGDRFARNPAVAPGGFAPYAPPAVAAAHPEHHSQLEELRRQAAEPLRVKVKYDYEDTRGIRDRGEAQGRRVFNREAKRSRYLSFSDVGVI
jgi:hypothetical protein